MLQNNITDSIKTLMANVIPKYTLYPKPDTPLAALMESMGDVELQGNATASDVVGLMHDASLNGNQEGSEHTELCEAFIDELSASVKHAMEQLVGNVLPIIAKTADKAKAQIENSRLPRPSIIEWQPSELLNLTQVIDYTKRFSKRDPACKLNPGIFNPDLTESEVVNMLAIGDVNIDSALKTFLAEQPEGYVLGVYQKLFLGSFSEHDNDYIHTQGDGYFNYRNNVENANDYVIGLLLCIHLADNPYEQAGIGLEAYQEVIAGYKYKLAHAVLFAIKRLRDMDARGQLVVNQRVLNEQTGSYDVLVYAPCYDVYIANGGTADEVLGAVSSGVYGVTQDTIFADRDRFAKAYEISEKALQDKEQASAAVIVAKACKSAINDAINDLTSDDVDLSIVDKKECAEVVDSTFDRLLERGRDQLNQSVYMICRNILLDTVWSYTGYKTILDNMDEMMANDAEISDRDCAQYEVIRMVNECLLSCVDVVPNRE